MIQVLRSIIAVIVGYVAGQIAGRRAFAHCVDGAEWSCGRMATFEAGISDSAMTFQRYGISCILSGLLVGTITALVASAQPTAPDSIARRPLVRDTIINGVPW